ncbi:MAG: electron transfer flavoprotein subunit alpha/FixB family protein [Candidatus Binatia bacterium]
MESGAITVCSWDQGRAGLPANAEEMLSLAAKMASAMETEFVWLVIGKATDRLVELARRYGVSAIDELVDPALSSFGADRYVEALAQYCRRRSPSALVISQTFEARLVAPRLAGCLGAAVVMNGVDVEVTADVLRITASAFGGDTRVVYEVARDLTCIVGLSDNALEPTPPGDAAESPPPSRPFEVDLGSVEERVRVVERAEAKGPRLEDAQTIVAGGRGLGCEENFVLIEQLAEALGGVSAASRPIVDEGWADPSQQVGLTGKITRPALYVAAGISGASQHMVGCSAAKTIVAINRDPDAAIFRYANYGIVGDCVELLPELTKAVKG